MVFNLINSLLFNPLYLLIHFTSQLNATSAKSTPFLIIYGSYLTLGPFISSLLMDVSKTC